MTLPGCSKGFLTFTPGVCAASSWAGTPSFLGQHHLWATLAVAPVSSWMEGETEALLGAQMQCAVQTRSGPPGTLLSLAFSSPLRSSPVADGVIQPAALEDLDIPPLAASSPGGDVSGLVSTALTAQRYGPRLKAGPQGPVAEAASLPSHPHLPLSPSGCCTPHRCAHSPAEGPLLRALGTSRGDTRKSLPPPRPTKAILFFLFLIFSIIADLQCSVSCLLHSEVTQSHLHFFFSHYQMLHHK